MELKTISDFLSQYLETYRFNDYCYNGVQVEASQTVKHIALGVSASLELFKQAKETSADTIIVHHGLFWKTPIALQGVISKRVQFLYRNDINLLGYHLPLDAHPVIGNNASIADALELVNRSPFAKHGGVEIGVLGETPEMKPIADIKENLERYFGQVNQAYFFGSDKIKRVAVVSGGAANDAYEAFEKGADLFITGEASEPLQEWSKESGMNIIAAGHASSEKSGIQRLGKLVTEKFKIPCTFIDIPNTF